MTTHRVPDSSAAAIERVLGTAAARSPAGQGAALHALYVCVCITEHPCPDWIIYGTDAGIGWRTWPDDLSKCTRRTAQTSIRTRQTCSLGSRAGRRTRGQAAP